MAEISSALISAGASLLGGMMSRDKYISPWQTNREGIGGRAEGARKFGEAYGFNPLTLLGVPLSGAATAPGGSLMGAAIADAGAALADGLRAKAAESSRITELERQNAELQKELVQKTIRAPVPGVFAARGAASPLGNPAPDSPKVVGTFSTPEFLESGIGPHPLVPVYSALSGHEFGLEPKVAARLDLKPYDPWIAEDSEALGGDLLGNVWVAGETADAVARKGLTGQGPFYDLGKPKEKAAVNAVPAPVVGDPQKVSEWQDLQRINAMRRMNGLPPLDKLPAGYKAGRW